MAVSTRPLSEDEDIVRALDLFAWISQGQGYLRSGAKGAGEVVPPWLAELVAGGDWLEGAGLHAERLGSDVEGTVARWKFKTEVERYLSERGGSPSGALPSLALALLAQMRERGYVQTRAEFAAAAQAATPAEPDARVTAFGMLTANRPEVLQRALDSYLAHLQKAGRRARLVVADDTQDAGVAAKNRAVAEAAAKQYGQKLSYVGMEERKQLIAEHAGGSAEKRAALEFLLLDTQGLGLTFGMNRNAMLLATQGELLFSADDDTLCNLFARSDKREALRLLYPGEESQPVARYASRDEAKRTLSAASTDVLAAMEGVLGRTGARLLGERAGQGVPVGGLSPEWSARLLGGGRVLVSLFGLVGDNGSAASPLTTLIEAQGPEASRLLGAGGGLPALAKSREVTKVAHELRLAGRGPCMTTFFGLDNREPVLPFFPHFRNEDQLFSEMLALTRPGATLAYLPYALEHAPGPRPEAPADQPRPPVVMHDVFTAALAETEPPLPGQAFGPLARTVASRLAAFASLSPEAYRRRVAESVLERKLGLLHGRRRLLAERTPQLPGDIASALSAQLAGMEKLLTGELVAADPQLQAKAGSARAAEELSQKLLGQMAQAIAALAG